MKRLYHQLLHRWGEPDDIMQFDGTRTARPGTLAIVHVAVWRPTAECDVATFFSLGMSEALMRDADYRAELHLGRRGPLSESDQIELARFVANITEYPFMHDLKLDWWERLANPGAIPGFADCTQVLFGPDLGAADSHRFEQFPPPDEDVRVLKVVPITPHENHLLKDHGRDAFLDYWETSGVDIWSPRRDPDGADKSLG
jgi:hypothetical protein